MITSRWCLPLASVTWLVFGSVASANDEALARVKDLYRSAAYEEALALLDQISTDGQSTGLIEANEYRLYCLIALERKNEARGAIESMVNADPLYQPAQASPRVRTMFKEVRLSLLPAIVQRSYADAKTAFERRDPQATAQFEQLLVLLSDSDVASVATFADLRTVVTAFRDLSKAVAPPPQPAPAAQAAAGDVAAPQSNGVANSPVVHREGEPGLTAPVAVNQTLPRWILPRGLERQRFEATLEIVIDENGDVIGARLLEALHPSYDAQLVKAALSWKYRPARKDGVPTRVVKLVSVRVNGPN